MGYERGRDGELFMGIHPLYFPIEPVKKWLCVEITQKYGEKKEEEDEEIEKHRGAKEEEKGEKMEAAEDGGASENETSTPNCPKWLTQGFHYRMIEIFTWYGNESYLEEVRVALKNLPKFVPPKEPQVSPKSPIMDKRKSRKAGKTAKVAPQGKE
mmetsp:Transcript_7067/g.14338  ORF Transcript_7067/g.14338 Transcript_7067/m.14338 type:complete len:155 (+) Transcript_7067:419-883(+)